MRGFLLGLLLGAVSVPLVLLILAYLGGLSINATADPSDWEAKVAHRAIEASLARQARGVTNPITVSDAVLLAGMKLYVVNCSGCHGRPGAPSHWGTRNFYPRVPQLTDHPSQLEAHEMFVVVKHGIRYSGMASWDGLMRDDDIWRTVTFLSSLRNLPPAVEAAWKPRANPERQ